LNIDEEDNQVPIRMLMQFSCTGLDIETGVHPFADRTKTDLYKLARFSQASSHSINSFRDLPPIYEIHFFY
jgi:hypothetical protein